MPLDRSSRSQRAATCRSTVTTWANSTTSPTFNWWSLASARCDKDRSALLCAQHLRTLTCRLRINRPIAMSPSIMANSTRGPARDPLRHSSAATEWRTQFDRDPTHGVRPRARRAGVRKTQRYMTGRRVSAGWVSVCRPSNCIQRRFSSTPGHVGQCDRCVGRRGFLFKDRVRTSRLNPAQDHDDRPVRDSRPTKDFHT
jgi:hypothetical protein